MTYALVVEMTGKATATAAIAYSDVPAVTYAAPGVSLLPDSLLARYQTDNRLPDVWAVLAALGIADAIPEEQRHDVY